MSTRANIIIKDAHNAIQLYRHCDGYPEGKSGVLNTLKKALPFAWPLPRMEANDMAAAIVRAWKDKGGNIYIDGTAQLPYTLHGDIEYYYILTPDAERGLWQVAIYDRSGRIETAYLQDRD